MEREKEVQGKYKVDFSWIMYIPIALVVGIVPLVVRFSLVPVKEAAYGQLLRQNHIVDIFSQYKAGTLMLITIGIGIMLFLIIDKKDIKKNVWISIYIFSAVIYVVWTVLSAMNSQYKSLAWWGSPDRAEGAIILSCYIVIMLYTVYTIRKRSDYKYILVPIIIVVIVTAGLGIFQYIGKDLFIETSLGNQLIIPEEYSKYRGHLTGMYEKGKIYGTMYHYNYIGSFSAMIIPLFMTLFLFTKGLKNKIIFGITVLLGFLILFGSTSRAGIIGLIASICFFIIIFAREIMKKWKMIIPMIVIGIIGILGLNQVTHGEIFSRIPSLINDAISIFISTDQTIDYKESLPIKGIYEQDNALRVETQGGAFYIHGTGKLIGDRWGLELTDEEGNLLSTEFTGETYIIKDARFQGIDIDGRTDIEDGVNKWLIRYNGESIFYFMTSSEEISYINPITEEKEEWKEPERIGFYGKERLGSARGYIWSRSIPLLKNTVVLGYGPDTYPLVFPQDDYLGKWAAYETTNMIVDKPHNLYLQIGIGQGIIALIAFVILVGTYTIQGFKLYGLKKEYNQLSIMGIGLMLAVVGYLGAGIFNDSIVSVAPIFWVLLGAGIATNYLVSKEQKSANAQMPHATINMKTRKHM